MRKKLKSPARQSPENKIIRKGLALGLGISSLLSPAHATESSQESTEPIHASTSARVECIKSFDDEPKFAWVTANVINNSQRAFEVQHRIPQLPPSSYWAPVGEGAGSSSTSIPLNTRMTSIEETTVTFYGRYPGEPEQVIGSAVVGATVCHEFEPLPPASVNVFYDCYRDPETGETFEGDYVNVAASVINNSGQTLEGRLTFDENSGIRDSVWETIPSAENSSTLLIRNTGLDTTPETIVNVELRRAGEEYYSEEAGTFYLPAARCGEDGPEDLEGNPISVGGPTTPDFERWQGDSRVETAIEISKSQFPSTAESTAVLAENVVLATAGNFPDALAGTPLASALDAPILLTGSQDLHPNTLQELQRLNAQTIYILGGDAAISQNVEQQLRDEGLAIERLAGENREETSVKVAEVIFDTNGDPSEIIVVPAGDFPDAIIAGPLAAQKDTAVLLSNNSNLSESVKDFLESNASTITDVISIDAEDTFADSAEVAAANAADATLTQIEGTNRADTSAQVAQIKLDSYNQEQETNGNPTITLGRVVVTTAVNWPDGLGAGTLAVNPGQVLLLANEDGITNTQTAFIQQNNSDSYSLLTVTGGENAVSNEVATSFLFASSR